ncbi:MAG: hypothetical protein RR964_09650 [Lachnospiraceae bacterium]
MFDFLGSSKQIFGTQKSYYEAAAEVNAEFTTIIEALPDAECFETYLTGFKERDDIEIVMKACTEFTFSSTNRLSLQENYKKFISDGEPTDDVEINIHIVKKYDDQNALSIYCFDEFIKYYNELSRIELLKFFVSAFSNHVYLRFEVLDKIVNLYTHSIGFCQEEEVWPSSDISRLEYLKKCEGASLFLNRIELPLVPYDFELLGNVVGKDCTTIELFRKLETIFSYLYMANSSYLIDEKIVLQFSPTQSGFDYELKNIIDNRYICQIFKWAYEGQNSVERTGIARNVIYINCKKSEQIIGIDEDIWSSIKSNYMLYQRKTTEQYIEMKNQISTFIVDSSKQLQEMIHDLIDGLKNNFIAVIMFLITIILTDSVDWEDFLNTGVLSQDLTFVTKIFIAASTAYLIVTFIAMIVKWLFFKSAYIQLKLNYKEVFDEKDMNKAFDDDKIVKKARIKIVIAAIVIGVIWIAFLGIIYYFISQVG